MLMSLLMSVSPGDSLGARPRPPYGLSDDESGGGRALSAESEVEEPARGPGEARGERPGPACQLCGGPTGEGPCCGAGGPGGGAPMPPRLLYSCRLCAFVSHYSSHLKRHMQTHSGEKPFRCGRCPYASAQLVNLTRHTRTHTGEKPYRCPHCPFACSSLGNLRRHQRTHAGPPTPPCPTCGFRCCAPRPARPPSPTEQEGTVPRRPEGKMLGTKEPGTRVGGLGVLGFTRSHCSHRCSAAARFEPPRAARWCQFPAGLWTAAG